MSDHDFETAARRLAAIVESSDDAIVSKDLNGVIVTWNPAAERMFGYRADEVIGKSILILIPDGRKAEEDEVLARIRQGREVAHFETIRQRKDGSLIPISLTVSPVRGGDGRIIGASKIARDISERREAEARVTTVETANADLQRRLLTLVAASSALLVSPRVEHVLPAVFKVAGELLAADALAVWRLDDARAIWRIEWSLGVSPEFTSQQIATLHGEAAPRLSAPLAVDDLRTNTRVAARTAMYELEGIRSMLAVPLNLHAEASGTFVFYYREPHAFDDVEIQTATALANLASAAITTAELYDTQRRSRLDSEFLAEAGKALSRSLDYEDTLKAVARLAVPYFADWCAVDLADSSGPPRRVTMAHVNPAKIDLATRFASRYPTDPDSPYSASSVIRTGTPVMLEHLSDALLARVEDADRRAAIRELNLSSVMIVPLRTFGPALGAITFVAAESGRRYNAADLQLAQEIAHRAALAVDNARAYDEARRANRVKDDFIATLSHELRTPLNALLGYARMLKQGMLPQEQHPRAINILERNATSLARIVSDVFDVSRIASGKLRVRAEIGDVAALVAQSIEAVEPTADAKGVRLDMRAPDTLLELAVDPERVQQVMWNLLTNSIKFTPDGGHVSVDVRRSADGRHVEIVVTDTGSGIAPEFLPYVFEPFRQADSRLAREYGGLGLGLAISRHLVELHGGTITAESAGLGAGATFTVRLPTAGGLAGDVHGDHDPLASPAVETAPPRLDGIHVLVLDDEPDALVMIGDILEAGGARVTRANSAERALALLPDARPDVILSDIGMPQVDGFEFIARVRALEHAVGRVPAAALTAFTRPSDRERALSAGFQMHLSKPIDPSELTRAVHALVRLTPGATRGPASPTKVS